MSEKQRSPYSVLMSVYKSEHEEYLEQSILSMLGQTLKPEQIVLVKDGPLTPELDRVISEQSDENPGLFTIVSLKKNSGLGAALDEGIKYCRNELIARVDSDDISVPDRCELQVEAFEKDPELSICSAAVDEFYDTPDKIVSRRVLPLDDAGIKKFMRRRSPFNHSVVMYKKSEVLRCGGYDGLRFKQDLDLFSRMLNNGCKGMNFPQSLLLCRSNEDMFKRRKSKKYCKSYIQAQKRVYSRHECSLADYLYVVAAQTAIMLMPLSLFESVSNKFLRKED